MMRLFADLLLYSTFNDMLVGSSEGMIYHEFKGTVLKDVVIHALS